MKTLYISVCILCFAATSTAQYLNFPSSGASWTVQTAYADGYPPSHTYAYYYSSGDTVINNKDYNRISGRYTNYYPIYPSDYWVYQMGDKFIRTDTVNGKAYWLNDTIDVLLFDYTLQVGDTINQIPLIIDSVFTMPLFGCIRRVQRYGDGTHPRYIVEGIGCTDGLFVTEDWEEYGFFEWSASLTCFSYNNETFDGYTIPYNLATKSGSCSIPPVGSTLPNGIVQVNKDNEILLAPNPAADEFVLTTYEGWVGGTITITDASGREMARHDIIDEHNKISTTTLSNGIYFVGLCNSSSGYLVKKLIVAK